jgi:ADP-ribose pyrophosphatase
MNQTSTITLCSGKFLALVREGRWEYVDRIGATGAAIVVAVTDDQKLLLVEQYRIPVHARTIELPAGIVGDEPGGLSSSSGLTSEVVTLLRASGLRRVSAGGGVAHEDITVHEVPLSEVHGWLAARASQGLLIEPKVYAGLYFIART